MVVGPHRQGHAQAALQFDPLRQDGGKGGIIAGGHQRQRPLEGGQGRNRPIAGHQRTGKDDHPRQIIAPGGEGGQQIAALTVDQPQHGRQQSRIAPDQDIPDA